MAVSKVKKEVSIREFAKSIGTSHTAVNKAIEQKKFVVGYNTRTKKINPEKAAEDNWVKQQTIVKPKAGVSAEKAIEKLNKKEDKAGPKEGEAEQDFEDMEIEELMAAVKVNGKMSYQKALEKQQIITLALNKLKLKQEAGLLVDIKKVNDAQYNLSVALKNALFDIPKRIARDLMAAHNEVEVINIMNEEITRVLLYFANMKISM